jgi:hypothetical protein
MVGQSVEAGQPKPNSAESTPLRPTERSTTPSRFMSPKL